MGTQTTPADILDALQTLIGDLNPAGGNERGVGIEPAFVPFEGDDWKSEPEEIEETELDRHFIIEGLEPQNMKIIGGCQYDMWLGQLAITIGHQIGAYRPARDRRDKDIHQIISVLVNPESHDKSYPTGVVKIRLLASDVEIIQEGLYWITLIRLGLHYKIAKNFGS